MIWGRETLRLRCAAPVTIIHSAEHRETLPAGELEFRLVSSQAAKIQTWFWLGNAREGDLSAVLAQALEAGGWETGLWPVGMNPSAGDWSVRDYRLLARPRDDLMSLEELHTRLQEIQPEVEAQIVHLPEGQGRGTVSITFDPPLNKGGQGRISGSTLPPLNKGGQGGISLPLNIESPDKITVPEAPVGEGFHWEHTETLELPSGAWMALGADGKLCAGAEIEVEEYLASVNSSEMPADSPLEFLKSQVVAARSWLLANWGSHHPGEPYTICNGDHCQCYYGPERIREASRRAVDQTAGQVLMHNRRICDARYAKSCGGVTEPAGNVWAFAEEPYLGHFADLPEASPPDLLDEAAFRRFQQRNVPEDACCSPGYAPLSGRLKELSNLYRWQEKTSVAQLTQTIRSKTGVDLGTVKEFNPLKRGPSGRLIELEISGADGSLRLSPELAIRRALSPTHLPSSAFWVEQTGDEINFHGLGWGHGVGLCQIGAAALAVKGWDYRQILEHYYRGAELVKVY
jgi:SpoIID/LytB domain protein